MLVTNPRTVIKTLGMRNSGAAEMLEGNCRNWYAE
jgi:hypothetical protein